MNIFSESSKSNDSEVIPDAEPEPHKPSPEGIPDTERQKVMDAIQEIDFYASLMLNDDAQKMLDDLIATYGDVDIIHEAKIRLESK